jgi:hypothetical protein
MMAALSEPSARVGATPLRGVGMLWIGVFAYLLALCTLGIVSLAKGHWVMFIVGFVLPPFWLVGAVRSPTGRAAEPVSSGHEAGFDPNTRAHLDVAGTIPGHFGN